MAAAYPRLVAPKPRGKAYPIAAPIGGWNAKDVIGAMPPEDAVTMTNWYPATNSVYLRSGYTQYSTGITGQVQTVIPYASTSNKLFAIASGSIYDCTAGGAVGAASVTGLSNSKFQGVNFTTTGGSYWLGVNGADKQQVFDGTTWHKDGDGAPYDITGVNSNTLIHVNVFKTRLWYVQQSTLKAWYLAVGAIGGAATALDLSSVFQLGGTLMAMGTWTIDAGYGVDDYAVWITTKGEIAVYRLTDPTTPTGISLIGIYRVGAPIGRRCFFKFAGDLLVITQDGLIPMSSIIQSDRLNPKSFLTNKIQFAISNAVTLYGSNFGWEVLSYPKGNQLYLNIPVSDGSSQQQYVMNTITGAWCNFSGWNANCWCLFNDDPYFGGNGYVGKAWNGYSDAGTAIQASCLQAFNFMGSAESRKRGTMIRPTLFTNGSPAIYGNINWDFDTSDTTAALTFSPTTYGTWDSGVWDSAVWGSDTAVQNNWQGATGTGKAAGIRLKVSASGIQVQWVSTDVVFEEGGIL